MVHRHRKVSPGEPLLAECETIMSVCATGNKRRPSHTDALMLHPDKIAREDEE